MPELNKEKRLPVPVGLGQGLLWAVIYWGLAKLGLVMASLQGNVSPVWPATGFAIWLIVWGGRRWWPAIAFGAFAANVSTEIPIFTAGLIAVGNTGEAMLGAWVFGWCRDRLVWLANLAEPVACIVSALSGALVSASIGVFALLRAGVEVDGRILWLTWWLGDSLGALSVMPLLLVVMDGGKMRESLRMGGMVGALLTMVAVLGISYGVFFYSAGMGWVFLVYPVLLLASLLHGRLGARLAAGLITVVALAAAVNGHGPFVGGELNSDLLRMQIFLASVWMTSLVLPLFRVRSSLLPLAVLIGGWGLSGWIFREQGVAAEVRDKRHLATIVADVSDRIVRRMEVYEDALRSGVGLHAVNEQVNQEKWRAFTHSLQLTERYPGFKGIGVIVPVAAAALDDFVAGVRREGLPDYTPRRVDGPALPAAVGTEALHYLIKYSEPLSTNRAVLGLDIGSEDNRREAIEKARDTGEARMSRRLFMNTDAQGRIGLIIYLPIYEGGVDPGNLEARRSSLNGWIYVSFVVERFLSGVMGVRSQEVVLRFYEGRSTAREDLLYQSANPETEDLQPEVTSEITLAGQVFTLAWNRRPGFVSLGANTPVLLASGMALMTLLFAGLVLALHDSGKRAQQVALDRTSELASLNRLQRAILDGTAYSIISTDVEGVIVTFNAGAERMLGYQRAEVVGKSTPLLIHDPEEMVVRANSLGAELGRVIEPGFEILVAQARAGDVEEREWTYLRRDGGRIPVLLSVSALKDEHGEISGFLGIAYDLTERRKIAAALQESEGRIQNIFLAMAEGVVLQDVTGAIVNCNAAAERILGLTHDQLIGCTSTDARWHTIRPDGSPFPGREHPAMETLSTGLACHGVIMGVHKADGTLTWISINSEPSIGANGRVEFVVCTFSDITERLEGEKELQKLALIASRTNNAVILTDADRRIEWVNEGFTRLSGYTLDDVRGLVPGDVLQGKDSDPAVVAKMRAAFESGVACQIEIKNYRKTGEAYWIRTELQPIRGATGKIEHWMAIQLDITEHKTLEANLALARDRALESSRLKSEFLANMSHEIRTPMNGIIGMSGLLMETLEKPEQREMGLVVQNSAESLLTIINDILDFSRIESGKLRIEPQAFDLQDLVDETLALLAPRAHAKGLDLLCEFDAELRIGLIGDPGRLRQVLLNLVGNAIKFTEQGEVVVSLQRIEMLPMRQKIRLEVRDTGIGIPREARHLLFQPFVQGDGSTTRRYGGTGLGLAISRQLVELMGGVIGFSEAKEAGSVFWCELSLPVQSDRTATLAPVTPGLRVLVVDDNVTNQQIMRGQLHRAGLQVETVGSAAAAMLQLHEAVRGKIPFDLAILDWQMPDQDGVALALAIRSEPIFSQLALIMTSSTNAKFEAKELERIRFEAVLNKPIRQVQLQRALDRAFDRKNPAENGSVRETATTSAPPHSRGLHLLLAEDNSTNQIVASRLLEKLGHQVDVVKNGEEAVQKIGQKKYAAVLMDCQMPVMDGYTATKQIRAAERETGSPRQPVIALTAYAMPSDRLKCFAAGMDDYIAKPVRLEDLQAALMRLGLVSVPVGPLPSESPDVFAGRVLHEKQIAQLRELPGKKYETLLLDLIEIFFGEAPEVIAKLKVLVERRESREIMVVAHRLAGSAANLGADEMRTTALMLEAVAKEEDWVKLEQTVVALDDEWERVKVAMQKLQSPPAP